MVFYALLARLDPTQSRLKVTKNLLDVLVKYNFWKLPNFGRSAIKILKLYEQYFLCFFKIEN